ncbi:hypothetical protein [Longimicrobium sp.]|uniref:hypothetical protein n=1 Tax=Longimicrobium sp. TaxID=2029185 RepID=UPI002F95215E
MVQIEIRNPSDYPRPQKERHACEYVFIPWERIVSADPELAPGDLGVVTPDGSPVPSGLIPLASADQVLAVRIDEPLLPAQDQKTPYRLGLGPSRGGGEEEAPLLKFEREGEPEGTAEPRETVAPGAMESVVRVRMVNELLNVWFDLGDHYGKSWFAGAASSVQFKELEVLDDFRIDPFQHDHEKRCMQIDRIMVSRPAWEDSPVVEYVLFTSRYTLVDYTYSPVAASITIASPALDYAYTDPFAGSPRALECRLYRRLTLFGGVNYVVEEVWMEGEAREVPAPVHLNFTARYFSYMEMGQPPHVTVREGAPGWSAISMPHDPRQGYGFATEAPMGGVRNPHPGYPNPDLEHRSFSWEVGPCRGYRCVHLFQRSSPGEILEHTSRIWSELIIEPLEVELIEPGATGG